MKVTTYIKQLSILLLFFLCASMIFAGCEKKEPELTQENEPLPGTSKEADISTTEESLDLSPKESPDLPGEELSSTEENSDLPQEAIYSYLQGIKSYEKGNEWAGSWCYEEAGGQQFSQFGCGICCLSNMYSTFTGTSCPPDVMYQWAQQYSDYAPESGVGALSWGQITDICNALDISTSLATKPTDYAQFQQMAAENRTLLVLVSSDCDDTIWQEVPGHYVNLWLYEPETDTVFLTDSKGPKNNRRRVPLSDVYAALKTSSSYQILMVP